MPTVLIIQSCLINRGGDAGGEHAEAGTQIAEVPKDTARALVQSGRALFVDPADDWDKKRSNTAGKDLLDAAAKAVAKSTK